jgi:glycosyltransferase involved in cell wall biosynthesis
VIVGFMKSIVANQALLNRLTGSALFDPHWYQSRFPDVALTGMSPAMHYLLIGSVLQRDPGPGFNCRQYLIANPTVQGSAFLHYLIHCQADAAPLGTGALLTAEMMSDAIHVRKLVCDEWQSLNEDPQFHFDLSKRNLVAGYYLFELHINAQAETAGTASKLYIDYGDGFNETDCIHFSVPFNTESSRFIYLRAGAKHIRFDPLEITVHFELAKFSLTEVDSSAFSLYCQQYLSKHRQDLSSIQSVDLVSLYQRYDAFVSDSKSRLSYQHWINDKEQPGLLTRIQVEQRIDSFDAQPLFSVIMPTYNTDAQYLKACIDSVLAQSYPHWELCIADDCSPKPHVMEILQEYAANDRRIKVFQREENGHISRASNSAIALASGDFIALLDHDDLLAKDALFFMAEAINQYPDGQIFYSDEDKIDLQGRRSEPHFKSDWNPDLFFAQNYVSHLGVYRSSLIEKIGGFRAGVEGSQDQDLLLRCLPHVQHDQIHHIPRILYHWRMLEGSTALASGEKSYTTLAGIKALTDYFAVQGPAGIRVEAGIVPNTYRLYWPLPVHAPKVSLLIPTRDRCELVEVAVRSILEKTSYPNYEIVILDNGSVEDETLQFFAEITQQDRRVKVLSYDYPFNYSAINNFGVSSTDGELVGLINNDIEVISPNWLTEMVSHAIRPDIGCVGAKLYYSNDLIQHAGVILGIGGVANHSHKMFPRSAFGYFARLVCPQNLSAVTAAVLLVKREIYQQVGGLNETALKVAFNDVDFCLKVREAGYRNLWTPYAELYHHESVSRGAEDTPEKQARFKAEVDYMMTVWQQQLAADPYYNLHLTRTKDDFSIEL